MAVKLLRAIRLDPSDTFVFERAAEPGEWLISGAFLFEGLAPEAMPPKLRTAFRGGFLGVSSMGWSTLGLIVEASDEERQQAAETLAANFMAVWGAPDAATARQAAEAELEFAASLCDHPPQTIIAVHRTFEAGEIRERFRTLTPKTGGLDTPFPVFEFYETEAEEGPDETLSLAGLAESGGRE